MNIKFIIKKYGVYCLIFISSTFVAGLLDKFFEPYYSRIIEVMVSLNILAKLLRVLFINLPVYSLLFGVFTVWVAYKIYTVFKLSRSNLKIIKATYGSNIKYIDITNELNRAIVNNRLQIIIDNNIAGDPHRRELKKAKVTYLFNSKQNYIERSEYEVLQLPSEEGQNTN